MTARTEAWPYDARRDDPLTALRIPVVTTIYPRWSYLVSLCINEAGNALWRGLRPSDAEAALLASQIGYERSRYRASYLPTLDKRPFDIDGGFNSLTFIKRDDDDWAYRRCTWEFGPTLIPSTFDGENPVGLAAALDRLHTIVDHLFEPWVEWKAAHPEVFGAVVSR